MDWTNYAMPQKRRNFLHPDTDMGQEHGGMASPDMAHRAQGGMDWKSMLPQMLSGFNQGGLLGAGLQGLGLWMQNRRKNA